MLRQLTGWADALAAPADREARLTVLTGVLDQARRGRGRPGTDAICAARLLGDPDLAARAATARADKLIRLQLEANRVIDPDDPTTADALALLDAP